MKKILLIVPPFYRLMSSHYNGIHLGIAYIAATLEKQGHEVRIYNADYQDSPDYKNQRQLFEGSTSYKTILNNLSHPIWQEVRDGIAGFGPDILGITMSSANSKAAQNIAKIGKALNPGLKIVVGGVHPTLCPEEVLAHEKFDYVIRGEGEFAFLELVEGRDERSIRGLSWKSDGKAMHNESRPFANDLDSLPFPSRDSFLNATGGHEVGYVITGRGCPFSCSYCASPKIWQRKARFRSISNVVEELIHIKTNHNSPLIHFTDDTFNLSKHRTKELCRRIIDERLDLNWVCEARVDNLDIDLVSQMVEAGCIRIKLGVESGSDRILKMMNKGFTTETIRQGVAIIKKCKLPLTIYLMVGYPGETDEDLRKSIALAKELDADYYSLSILAPYYGTQVWKELKENGKLPDKEHWEFFYHQSQEMVASSGLDPATVSEFLALNEREGKGNRI